MCVQKKISILLREGYKNLSFKMNSYFFSRIILGGVFIYSGIIKILSPTAFSISISNYKLLPQTYVFPLAIILPMVEFFFGLTLIFNVWTRFSTIILSSLLIIFIFAMLSALIREIDISCGCFSFSQKELRSQSTNLWFSIIRD